MRRLSAVQLGTHYTILLSTLILSATLLFISGIEVGAAIVLGVAVVPGFSLLRLWKKIDRIDRMF